MFGMNLKKKITLHFFTAIILLFVTHRVIGNIEDILKNEDFQSNPELEFLVTDIILRTSGLNCLAVICDETNQHIFRNYFFDKMKDIPFFKVFVKENEDLSSPNYATLATVREIKKHGCRTYVILMANGDQVGKFLKFGDKNREIDERANFILFLDNRLLYPELHYLWKKLINVVFIRKFASHFETAPWYELSTVPFPAPIRGILIPRRLDTWRKGSFYSNFELFRDKTLDLKRQILKVITFQQIPAAFKMPAPAISKEITLEGSQPIGYSGLEIEILDTLSMIMNFESEVYDVPAEEKWGIEKINGSFSGLIGEIVSGRADIALGNLYYIPYHLNLMDLTIPYSTQCLTFLTPESLTDNSWQTLLLPFRAYLWTGILISFVSGALVFLAFAKFQRFINTEVSIINIQNVNNNMQNDQSNLRKNFKQSKNEEVEGLYQFEHFTNSMLYTYSMLLSVSLPKLPSGWSLRIFTGWWWIYCILVVVAYRASMTSILANPVPRVTIDTLDQLAESGIAIGGWGEEIKKFFQTSLDIAGKKIGSKFEVIYDTNEAIERVAKGEFAYYENIHFLRHTIVHRQIIAMGDRIKNFDNNLENPENMTEAQVERNLHIMRDCVINMPISLGLQKNSPLKPRIDRFLRMIIEAGLVKKWLNDAMAEVLIVDSENDEPIKALMNLKKLLGAFVALGIGYGLSILVLLGEIINWKVNVVRDPFYDKYSNSVVNIKKSKT